MQGPQSRPSCNDRSSHNAAEGSTPLRETEIRLAASE